MKTISMTPEEHELLLEIMQCCLSDLRVEITRTDHWDYKRRLRERKVLVIQLLEKLKEMQVEESLV